MTSKVQRLSRARMKALRLDNTVDSQREFAGRIVQLLKAASHDNPGEWSQAYADHIIDKFSTRYIELCRVAPVRARRP